MPFDPRDFAGWPSFFLSFLGGALATVASIVLTVWIGPNVRLMPVAVCAFAVSCIQAGIFRESMLIAFCGSLLGSVVACAAAFFAFLYFMGSAFQ